VILAEDIGFFYYWIATDFQSLGFGLQAAHLLFDLAETHWGLRVCYAKCFADNHPSRRALAKLGFELLDIHVRTENDNELHYRRVSSGCQPALDVLNELRFLF
jgi:RimJ/RimL family protein N-acetyltransferase